MTEPTRTRPSSDLAFTPAVKEWQRRLGSRKNYQALEERGGWSTRISPDLKDFLAARDSFYLGTATASGQPYIQHRGGPPGFLRVQDETTLAFADFSGNRQFITAGNLSENDRAYLFLMDYPRRQRIKIWGRAEVIEDDQELLQKLHDPAYRARPERAIVFHVEAWDANCPQHIQPRFTQEEIAPQLAALQGRIADLERQLDSLHSA